MACKKCGQDGHYASTCGREPKGKKPGGAKRKAGASAKRAAAPAAAPLVLIDEPPAVADQLALRADWLRGQLARAEQWQRELDLIEKLISDLGGAA